MKRIVIADDHPLYRSGIAQILYRLVPQAHITEVGNGEELMAALNDGVELLFLDLYFPNFDYRTDIATIKTRYPSLPIVAISMMENGQSIRQVLNAGLNGFISKKADSEELSNALETIINGDTAVLTELTDSYTSTPYEELEALSPRQREVLKLLCDGCSNKEIANALGLSPFTVRTHISALMRAMDVSSRTAVVAFAAQHHFYES